jgi:hypothetical protein
MLLALAFIGTYALGILTGVVALVIMAVWDAVE